MLNSARSIPEAIVEFKGFLKETKTDEYGQELSQAFLLLASSLVEMSAYHAARCDGVKHLTQSLLLSSDIEKLALKITR